MLDPAIFSKLGLKWVQRTCQRAAIAKLQIQSNPAIFLLSEKPYYLRWKKIPTLQECKCPRGGWCTSAPRAAGLTPFCLISYPGRVTLSRGGWWWPWESPSNHHCTLQTHTQPSRGRLPAAVREKGQGAGQSGLLLWAVELCSFHGVVHKDPLAICRNRDSGHKLEIAAPQASVPCPRQP